MPKILLEECIHWDTIWPSLQNDCTPQCFATFTNYCYGCKL